jgi:hypothetical protein
MPDLPILYVPPARYTNRTNVLVPLIPIALKALAVMGVEWTTLDFIEHAPRTVKIATFVISLCVLAVTEKRDWLNFKGRKYFYPIITLLLLTYIGISGWSYWKYEQPINTPSTNELPQHTNQASAPSPPVATPVPPTARPSPPIVISPIPGLTISPDNNSQTTRRVMPADAKRFTDTVSVAMYALPDGTSIPVEVSPENGCMECIDYSAAIVDMIKNTSSLKLINETSVVVGYGPRDTGLIVEIPTEPVSGVDSVIAALANAGFKFNLIKKGLPPKWPNGEYMSGIVRILVIHPLKRQQ